MKRKKNKEKIITVKIEGQLLERIDKYAKIMKLNRSQLLRNLIEIGLDDLSLMQSTGMLTMAAKGYDLLGVVKKSLSLKKFSIENDQRIIIEL